MRRAGNWSCWPCAGAVLLASTPPPTERAEAGHAQGPASWRSFRAWDGRTVRRGVIVVAAACVWARPGEHVRGGPFGRGHPRLLSRLGWASGVRSCNSQPWSLRSRARKGYTESPSRCQEHAPVSPSLLSLFLLISRRLTRRMLIRRAFVWHGISTGAWGL